MQLTTMVCSTFITPLEDAEDIKALSNALSRITKVAKKAAQRFVASQAAVRKGFHAKQLALIEQGAETLCQMVRELRHGPRWRNAGTDWHPPPLRGRSRQADAGIAQRHLLRTLRAARDARHPRSDRNAGKNHRPLPGRGQHHLSDRFEELLGRKPS